LFHEITEVEEEISKVSHIRSLCHPLLADTLSV
jgi:hypothetical protein